MWRRTSVCIGNFFSRILEEDWVNDGCTCDKEETENYQAMGGIQKEEFNHGKVIVIKNMP